MNTGDPIEVHEAVGDGHVLIARALPNGPWILTWLPPQGDAGWPGSIYDGENSDMPAEEGAQAILNCANAALGAAVAAPVRV